MARPRPPRRILNGAVLLAVAAMAAVVLLSNVLVQHPVGASIGQLNLADLLTWGAFSYPLTFLVTDTTNRLLGPRIARRVVYVGFALAVTLSIILPPALAALGLAPAALDGSRLARIAIASGAAFLIGQLLDIGIFNRLRDRSWWRAPAFSSILGSTADTVVFFALAFAPALALLGPHDLFALEPAPLLGLYPVETPRWTSWALGDLAVKLLMAVFALAPYRIIVGWFAPLKPAAI